MLFYEGNDYNYILETIVLIYNRAYTLQVNIINVIITFNVNFRKFLGIFGNLQISKRLLSIFKNRT